MTSILSLYTWFDTHAALIAVILAAITAVSRVVFSFVTKAVARYPRAKAVVESIGALSPDIIRFVSQIYKLATNRDLSLDTQGDEIARLRTELEKVRAEKQPPTTP